MGYWLSSPLDLTLFIQSVYTPEEAKIPLRLARIVDRLVTSKPYLACLLNGHLLTLKMPRSSHVLHRVYNWVSFDSFL